MSWGGHLLFNQLGIILTKGMNCSFKKELSESDHLVELTQMLEQNGNHKSSEPNKSRRTASF
jgi:hypothetical protein